MKYYVLFLLAVFSATINAEHIEMTWTNSTARTDGTPFDANTELSSVEIGCGNSVNGPFDTFMVSVPNVAGSAAPTQYTTEDAPNGLAGCVAFSVDTNGIVSAPSNVARASYRSPVEAIQDLQTRCYGGCPGTLRFDFIIEP